MISLVRAIKPTVGLIQAAVDNAYTLGTVENILRESERKIKKGDISMIIEHASRDMYSPYNTYSIMGYSVNEMRYTKYTIEGTIIVDQIQRVIGMRKFPLLVTIEDKDGEMVMTRHPLSDYGF